MILTLPIRLDPTSPPHETLHVTASGLPVLIYNVNGGGRYPIHGAVYTGDRWELRSWLAGGKYDMLHEAHDLDLRDRAPVKRGYWIGVYTKGEQRFAGTFPSERDALAFDGGDGWRPFGVHYLAEGDGLDTRADPNEPLSSWGSRQIAEYLDQRRKAPPMTYREAMEALADAADAAVRAADNEDGAPVEALRGLAVEIACLIAHNGTPEERAVAWALFEGAKLAGTVR